MRIKLHTLFVRRASYDREVQEPTLLAMTLTAIGFIFLVAVCLVGAVSLPAFGHAWCTFTAVAIILAFLTIGSQHKRGASSMRPAGRKWWFRLICQGWRLVISGVLTCWLGLIVWSALRASGPMPPPKEDAALIRVLTWNIHCGQDQGPPWKQFDWPQRKYALHEALQQAQPDILSVQEATPQQVAFLEIVLSDYRRVGVGRDGEAGGEHCAIYFNEHRFELIDGSTFWLEEPIDQPRPGSALDVKRICTWVRLHDRVSGRNVRVYNTHLYLTEAQRLKAASLIIDHVASGARDDAILLTADFNASPSTPSRRRFIEAGLGDSAARAGKPVDRPTFHLYGIGLWCIDGVLVDSHWRVANHLILDVKPRNTFPSDHFAVLADLDLRGRPPHGG